MKFYSTDCYTKTKITMPETTRNRTPTVPRPVFRKNGLPLKTHKINLPPPPKPKETLAQKGFHYLENHKTYKRIGIITAGGLLITVTIFAPTIAHHIEYWLAMAYYGHHAIGLVKGSGGLE